MLTQGTLVTVKHEGAFWDARPGQSGMVDGWYPAFRDYRVIVDGQERPDFIPREALEVSHESYNARLS